MANIAEMNQYHIAYNILYSLALRDYMDRLGHQHDVTYAMAEEWAANEVDSLTIAEAIEWVQDIMADKYHLSTSYDNDGNLSIGLSE